MTSPSTFTWKPEPDDSLDGMTSICLMESATAKAMTPEWTIAIPTFRRPALLIDTVRSVLAQTDLAYVELIVVDNDPDSRGVTALLDAIPALREIPFRYFRNSRNVGMFGNWNACLHLARGDWVSVLNDDDLLHPDFIANIRRVVQKNPSLDAVTCSYQFMDCRDGSMIPSPIGFREQIRNMFRFGFSSQRHVIVRNMFFGSITGSSLGLVARREAALAIGGFHSAEYPSADYYFAARLARGYRFVQIRRALAIVRIAENESARPETLMGFIRRQGELQRALLGREAPRWWAWFQAPSLHLALTHLNHFWRASLNERDVSQETGLPISSRGARLTRVVRLLIGAI